MEYSLQEIKDGTGWDPDQRFTTASRYNGWRNYETWNVSLWLDNDEYTYNEVREIMREIRADHEDDDTDDIMSRTARGELADRLKDYVNELPEVSSVTETASMASDLLSAALSEVDWYEMAEHYLSED